ncbi:MAG: hypothetical protein ACJASX_002282 [Limisphaerales bacterium]|jgi:hypothetical protein
MVAAALKGTSWQQRPATSKIGIRCMTELWGRLAQPQSKEHFKKSGSHERSFQGTGIIHEQEFLSVANFAIGNII